MRPVLHDQTRILALYRHYPILVGPTLTESLRDPAMYYSIHIHFQLISMAEPARGRELRDI
jgi:hypothetical protein